MDYLIIFVTTVAGLYFHGWLYVRIKRWMDRDLALSLAGKDEDKRAFMLERLAEESRMGNYGIYFGNQNAGQVAKMADPAQEKTP